MDTTPPFKTLTWQLRRLFQRLASEFNALNKDLDVSAGQRAVLEFLARNEPQTVPQIAREHSVSRQHIQQLVNELSARGLIELIDNPAHKRSSLLRRSPSGQALFDEIVRREEALMRNIETHFNTQALTDTTAQLEKINHFFQTPEWEQIKTNLNK